MGFESRFSEYQSTFNRMKSKEYHQSNKFLPQKHGKNVSIFAGIYNGKYSLSVEGKYYDCDAKSTHLIEVLYIENGDKFATVYRLLDDSLISIFISFAIDLESLVDINNDVLPINIYNRYIYWQKMFMKRRTTISEKEVKGLINELFILKNYLIPKYGIEDSINGWIGTNMTKKDFALSSGVWFEAKAISVGKKSVRISSIDQLVSAMDGFLVVSFLEKTSEINEKGINLFYLMRYFLEDLNITESLKTAIQVKVYNIVSNLDFISDSSHVLNKYRYLFKKTNFYLVDSRFPQIDSNVIPKGINEVKYSIYLDSIEIFKVEDEF